MLCQPPLLILTGPTATGKTAVACALAASLPAAEIISADSRQIYRGMDIGTAKPNLAERAQTTHHLIDIRLPDQTYSAGQFAVDAAAAIRRIRARGAVPILAGGTGLYIQALLDGLQPVRQEETEQVRCDIRNQLRKKGLGALYDELNEADASVARRISPADAQRVTRALECVALGKARTGRWGNPETGCASCAVVSCCLSRPRESLYARIDRRTRHMVREGLLGEVAGLLDAGYDADCAGLRTLGYSEALACLQHGGDEEEMISLIQRRTRRYAKRQLTWFGRDRRYRWLDVEALGTSGVVERIRGQMDR